MSEALACGTPVLGLRRGTVPEVVADGVTGFVRDTEAELAVAAQAIPRLDRAACRQRVDQYFSAAAMADGYEAVYQRLVATRLPERRGRDQRQGAVRVMVPAVVQSGQAATLLPNGTAEASASP
jgi:hypothetical protein